MITVWDFNCFQLLNSISLFTYLSGEFGRKVVESLYYIDIDSATTILPELFLIEYGNFSRQETILINI